jgi:hypothetical protein
MFCPVAGANGAPGRLGTVAKASAAATTIGNLIAKRLPNVDRAAFTAKSFPVPKRVAKPPQIARRLPPAGRRCAQRPHRRP